MNLARRRREDAIESSHATPSPENEALTAPIFAGGFFRIRSCLSFQDVRKRLEVFGAQ